MSQLQFVGIFVSLAFFIVGGRSLRIEREESLFPLSILFTGFIIGLVAIFPNIAQILSDILAIGKFTGSRLIALLMIGFIIFWVLIIILFNRITKLNRQFDRYIRNSVVSEFLEHNTSNLKNTILCIIPALNEEYNLKKVLRRFPKDANGVPINVLVVDDGSTDNTSLVVKAAGCLLAKVPVNRGGGAALRTGFDIAVITESAVVVTIDADGQNDPEVVPDLVQPVIENEADVIIGSRILGKHEITHWWRHLGVILFSRLINLLMGTKITDCSSGYRAIRTESLKSLRLFQDQYHTSEFLILSAKKKLKIDERPIVFRRRISGKSKKGHELLYAFRFFYVLTTTWLRGK